MFKYMIKLLLIIVLIVLPVQIILSQSVMKHYGLDMKIPEGNVRWSWLVYANRTSFALDSNETVKGKYALKILSRRRIGDPHEASFKLMRTIPLPEWSENEVSTVAIRCKNRNMKNLNFSVIGIDENEDPQFSDSIFVTKNSWKKYSISFTKKKIKAIRISLSLAENHLLDMQTAWVDRISISVGGKTINDVGINDLYSKTFSELNNDYIIPLSFQNDENIQKIFSSNNCPKIIGLGESTHGSQEIKEANYQFMKTLIDRFGYKIILTEKAMDLSLICDLYIRGLLPESYENQIMEDCKGYFDDYLSFFDFLNWVREYNKTTEVKVRIFGCNSFLDKTTGLFDYFQKILDKTNSNLSCYLKNIAEGQFKIVRDMVMNDILLKSKIGSADFNYLIFLLEKDDMNLEKKLRDQSYDRDEEMWIIAKKIIEIYASGNEKVIVSAHSDHVSKHTSFLNADLNKPTLGNYMTNRYSKNYFAISFQIGEGCYTQDEDFLFGKTMIQMLQRAPKSSFEYRGLQTGFDYFYYSAEQLPKDIIHLRILLRTGRYLDQFYFCSVRKYFDGLVFIRNTHNLNKIESYPAFYFSGLIQYKQKRMREVLEEQGIKLKSECFF